MLTDEEIIGVCDTNFRDKYLNRAVNGSRLVNRLGARHTADAIYPFEITYAVSSSNIYFLLALERTQAEEQSLCLKDFASRNI